VKTENLAQNLFPKQRNNALRVMEAATVNNPDRIDYLENLMALTQLYLELNLSVTDAILAAESDLVTWRTVNRIYGGIGLTTRRKKEKSRVYRYTS
jgi:hypothetical protein